MNTVEVVSVIATLFNVASLATYFKQLRKSESVPNPATWLIWMVFMAMNVTSFFLITDRNIWLSLLSLVNTIGTTLLFFYSLSRRKFARLGKIEIISLAIASVIGIYWAISKNAVVANVSLQSILIISYYPTCMGLINKTLRERPLSWIFSAISYMFLFIVVYMERSNVSLFALVFPLVTVLLNMSVVYLSVTKNRSYDGVSN